MKYLSVFFLFVYSNVAFAQGNFAGQLKPHIGKKYKEDKELSFLNDFVSRGGSLISNRNDPEKFIVSWFSQATTIIALLETVDQNNNRQITDILKIENVGTGQELKIGDCTDEDSESVAFMALVVPSKAERWRAIKAWYCNRDKIRFEAWPAAKVSCVGMVGDD